MTDIIAKAICDSYATNSPRLLTIFTRSPTFNHQETLRHRKIYIEDNLSLDADFSFSVSSSRAIPFAKRLEEVTNPSLLASPIYWGSEQKGMSPGEELDNKEKIIYWPDIVSKLGLNDPKNNEFITKLECAERLWELAANYSAAIANLMAKTTQIHKTIPNRMVAPYTHTNALLTATDPGWLNFFGLRLDKAADPTLRALAESCWKTYNKSQPQKLSPGQWHLPYITTEEDCFEIWNNIVDPAREDFDKVTMDTMIKVSVARCARLSYQSFETGKRSTIEEDLKLYDRLVGSYPIHASPAEHQATPDIKYKSSVSLALDYPFEAKLLPTWENEHLSGNLGPGWIQYRKTLPNESIAPLPKEYEI